MVMDTKDVSLYDVSGNDVIFKVGSGRITVSNVKSKYVETLDSSNNRLVIATTSINNSIDNK